MTSVESPDKESEATLLVQVPAVDFFSVKGQEKEKLGTGDLNVLSVVVDKDDGPGKNKVVFFVVGEYTCPLAKHIPALSMGGGYYVFPLPTEFYGVQVPDGTPQDAIDAFEKILSEHSLFRQKSSAPSSSSSASSASSASSSSSPSSSKKDGEDDEKVTERSLAVGRPSVPAAERIESVGSNVAQGIETGGKLLAGGLQTTAHHVGHGMRWGSHWLISKIKPRNEAVKVPERVENNIGKARQLSGIAVRVSAALVTSVITMTGQLATVIAEEVKQTDVGKKLDDKIAGESTTGGPKVNAATNAAKDVAVSALVAAGEVQTALFQAGVTLLDNATSCTADVVTHKYGEDAGKATRESMSVVTDTARTARNMAQIGPKSIIKSTVKKTTANIIIKDDEKRTAAIGEVIETRPDDGITSGVMKSLMGAAQGGENDDDDNDDHNDDGEKARAQDGDQGDCGCNDDDDDDDDLYDTDKGVSAVKIEEID